MTRAVTRAVIPAAGLGTRFLPVAKSVPKEMLPVVDTPVIQFVVEEAAASGLTEILIVTARGKGAIEAHFGGRPDLERRLVEKGDDAALAGLARLESLADIRFVDQGEAAGLGHAVGCARAFTGDEPFVVLLGDAIIDAVTPAAAQLIACHEKHGGSVVAVERVPRDKVSRYGIVSGEARGDRTTAVTGIVEKPSVEDSPSDLAVAARYLLTPGYYEALDATPPGLGGEVQITDALDRLAGREPVFAWRFEGTRHDVGDKLDYLKTQVEFALKRDEFRAPFARYLRERLGASPDTEE